MSSNKGKSPYAKQHKTPYLYSAEYHDWSAAIGSNGIGFASERALDADDRFREAFGIDPRPSNYGQVYGADTDDYPAIIRRGVSIRA